jgi:integrase
MPTGIQIRHSRRCRTNEGGACNCTPSYRAWVYDKRRHTKVRETFATLAAAKAWRADATTQQNRGKRIGPSTMTLAEAARRWLEGAEADPPTVLTRGGQPYKPAVLREYRRVLETFVLDDLGDHRLSDIRRGDLQALIDRLIGEGKSGSTVHNVLMPVRVIYRHALERDEVAVNPTTNLRLPNGSTPRDRAASAAEAAELLTVLPADLRPIYATAFYAGLRRGELRALRWDDVDLAAGLIHVRHGWDDVAGEIAPKSAKGTRTVPIVAVLRDQLAELKAGGDQGEFVFGSIHGQPFTPSNVRRRAAAAWAAENAKRTERKHELLVPIGLHECRHTFVSLMHDAGLSLERIGDYAGHSSSYMTDRYRHLLDGHEDETRRLVDAYLARADTAARVEQLEGEVR